jgi:hypothetical protein
MAARSGGTGQRALLAASCLVGLLAVGIRVGVGLHSRVLGALAMAVMVSMILGLVALARSRAEGELQTMSTSGVFALDAAVIFQCLPGDWPRLARRTLLRLGADNMRALPMRFTVSGRELQADKKRSRGMGRRELHLDVPLVDIQEVRIEGAQLAVIGSTLVLDLRSGEELRAQIPHTRDRAEVVARHLRREVEAALAEAPRPLPPPTGMAMRGDPRPPGWYARLRGRS